MTRNLPARTGPAAPARVIHYVDVAERTPPADVLTAAYLAAPSGELAALVHRQAHALAERQRRDRIAYARWVARRIEQQERDRRVRRFWLGFGAIAGLGVCALVVLAGWLVYHAIVGAALGLAGVGVAVLLLAGLAAAGHKCVTVVQHWH